MKLVQDIEGGDALVAALAAMPDAVSDRIMTRVLKAAAEPMRDRMAANAHRSSPQAHPEGHIGDHILIQVANRIGSLEGGRWRARNDKEYAVAIGPDQRFWWGIFGEYGTPSHSAIPFARPAFDSEAQGALGAILDGAWLEISKVAKRYQNKGME
jgi:HK97 gp10 family phage protein